MKKITLLLLMVFFSVTGYSQLALEGFETTTGPDALPLTSWPLTAGNWAVFDNGVGTAQRWGISTTNVCSGTQIAYMRNENIGAGNTSEDYLATPAFTVPANGELHFKTRSFQSGNQGTIYQIKIAPAVANQTDPISYTIVQQYTEAELTAVFNVCEEKVVDLSAYAGVQVYVAFVMKFTQPTTSLGGDRWLVDDVSVDARCAMPTSLTFSGLTANGANLNWANPGGATSWEIEVILATGTPTGVGVVYSGALPYAVTGLLPNTAYKYYVRAICGSTGYASAWAGPSANFTTTTAPAECGGNYVDTGGTTANYGNNENATTTICPSTPGELVTVTFTAFNTQAGSDILSIYDGDSGSATLLGAYSGTALPPTFTSSAASGCLTFIFVSNGTTTATGWAANVTCAPPPPCQQPVALTTSAVLSTSATLSWTNVGLATSWEVLALPCLSPAPNATTPGWIATTSNPYTFTGLTPNTCYDLYVRGNCSSTSNGVSAWSGPKSITTSTLPPVCGGNYVDSGGPTGVYANNELITTTICPTIIGEQVTVAFTAFNTEGCCDFLSIYNGDTAIAANLLGTYSGTTLPPTFTSNAANGCLTFVFDTDGSVTAAGYIANVTCAPPPVCQQPNTLVATATTADSVTLGWTNAGVATSWEVIALPCGSPAPNATTTGWTATTTNSYTFTGLTSATCYDLYVRGNCDSTSNGVSLWAGPRTVTTQVAPPVCGGNFVDAAGPTTNYANNSDSTVTICPITAGDQVTVTFTAFDTEATWDGLYVFDGDTIFAPQITSANPAGNVPGGLAGSYWGTVIPGPFTSSSPDGCLTFRFRSDGSVNRPGWIANVTCAPPPVCQQPTALTTTALLSTSVTLGWTNVGLATSWEVLALPCGSPAPNATTTGWIATTSNPYNFTGLTSATCYDLYVRGNCSSSSNGVSLWAGPRTVTTQVAPPECGGNFVDAGGATANYANNSNITTTICPSTPGEIVTVTFTAFQTEATWDGLYVYDGDAVIPANQIASANPPGNVPGGLAGSYWGNTIPGPFTSTTADGCLTFVFRSDASVNNPGWVANITCSPAPTCARPILVTASSITQTSAQISWTQPLNPDGSQATAWEVLVLPAGSPVPTTGGIPATSPYTATGLSAGTAYVFYVRAICTPTDSSVWSALNFAALPINDECANATFAIVNQNLNCVQTTHGTLSGATGSLPTTTCPGVINDDVWFTFTATAVTHIISFNNVTPATALNYAIFQGTDCGALTQVGCNSGANLIPGTTYYVRVYSATAIPQYTNFDLCIGTLPCTEAPAFCTGQTVTYANSTNVPSLGQVGCLFTSPNPAFFFLQVNQAGPLSYLISQVDTGGTPRDVDYVAWGPFTDLNTACSGVPANPLPGATPIPTPTTGCPGTLHACSYSAAPQEIMCIPNAQLCEVYVIMITNFSNQAGTVTFTQTNTGGGTTECFPINTFNYPQTFYCQDGVNPTPVLAPGASAGTYTSTAGLVIDSVTGTIDLAASTPGPYIITSTTLTSTGGVCTNIPSITTTRTVIITAPANATIAYEPTSYCNNITSLQAPIHTGTTGGVYSATPAGLLINQNTGEILPIASQPGVYAITYTVPATGGCPAFSTPATVEIIDAPTPTFTQVTPICPGDALANLPTTSNDGITGTWSPAMNNTATTTYTFTPTPGVCARNTTMTIGVGSTTPVFTQVAPICPGAVLADLPTTSDNGVTGTWSPAMDNTTTTTYTFTPTPGLCSGVVTMTIQILTPSIVPTFNAVAPICPGGILTDLPTTSNNGITGVWSPALDNTVTTTYTFTPDTAQCALSTTLTIIVNPELVVTVNSPSFCPGSTATVTATPSVPGTYTYTWTVPIGATDPGNVASFTTSTVGTYSVVITQTNNFCNTDFESPFAPGATPYLVNESTVPCWDTTSPDGIIEIWPPGFEGVTAYSGNQLIELNGNTPGTLFQDFNVIPGTTINISFAHRGRQGNDVVGVEVGPVGGPYVSLGNFTDNNTAWALHSVNYTIPTGGGNNYTLRFVSVSSTGGDPSIGNLLDSISISSLGCPSQPASGTVSFQNIADPTVTITQPTCAVPTGTIEVTSPLGTGGGGLPTDLFISEITDENVGALSYIEIYNGTGAAKNLANYKIKIYNNGNSFTSCEFSLTGTLNNNDTYVISVAGGGAEQGGVIPDFVDSSCSGGVNTNDNIRLTSDTDVEIDSWGRTDGIDFTPSDQAGYTYRRNANATIPSLTWNTADWTALDPQDYTNVGSYALPVTGYQYAIDTNPYQASPIFTGVAPGDHTITVQDMGTGCFSNAITVTIDPVPQYNPVTEFSYTSPVCQNNTTNPSPIPATGFTTGGVYSSTTGLVIDSTTGVINLAASTAGSYDVTYAILTYDPATCIVPGSYTTQIVITPVITPVVAFTYTTPVCKIDTTNPSPIPGPGFTTGGVYSSTTGLTIDGSTGVINLATSTAGTYNVTYTVNADVSTCQVANSYVFEITITPATAPITAFSYTTPVCPGSANILPIPVAGFVTGGTYSSTGGLVIDGTTGEIDLTLSTSGTYTITYSIGANPGTCQSQGTNTAVVVISGPVEVSVDGDCVGPNYTLTASPIAGSFDPNAVTYAWVDASGDPVLGGNAQSVVVTDEGVYTVTVTSNGCTGLASFTADSISCVIQKGISVNNTPDGKNDFFDLRGLGVRNLGIFNRYGMKVYNKSDYTDQWKGQSDNGDELPDGTYYYVIERDSGETNTGWIYINREKK